MNLKKVSSGYLVFLLVLVVSACESNGVNGGIGKATELNLREVKAFMDDEKTGFLYVKSAFDSDSDKELDRMQLSEIERVAEAEKIDFYVFDAKELPTSELYEQDTSKRTLLLCNIQEPSPFIKRVKSKRNWILKIFQKMMFLAKLKNLFKI
ncbi:hypothetical protein J2Y73_002005 [Peribacillus frigoritolerans]|uniref:hypothetical protein n=1 Tax=Peribacillus frigoritolerans TaxID=450367 RepID=UPI00209DDF10|nr:hypothetical protein [Peribacillus frigoritolerans]MCP1491974.1 hypothetical protein [Peribacillus frigoritolerans]